MATGHFRRSYMRMSVLYAKGDSDSDENGDRHDGSSYYSYASAVPVKGESFCDCPKGKELPCLCGEDDTIFDWTWDSNSKSAATYLSCNDREVKFHLDYSCGTAAVRGNKPMRNDQYFWEIKMTTPVYGTDMMVGVGTMHTNLDRFRYHFTSLLGRDCESWGLSYTGLIHHKGETRRYSGKFGQGSIMGVHLDMWRGTLAFYKNRRPLGVAYRGLQGKILFPMVSSTAARSGMKVIRSCSFPSSLQFLCCMSLRKSVPPNVNVLEALDTPPGLKTFLANNLDWLLSSWEPEQKNEKLSDWPQRKSRKRTRSESSDETEDLICCKKGCE